MRTLWRALTRNHAVTDAASRDPALRGRTYAIPFQAVWTEAIRLADGERPGGLPRWRLIAADGDEGVVEAEAVTPVLRSLVDVRIEVGLDENAQTRVDAASRSRGAGPDFGANRRRIRRFLAALDERLEAMRVPEERPGAGVRA